MASLVPILVGMLILSFHKARSAPTVSTDQSSMTIEQRVTTLERTIHGLQTQNQQLVDCVMNISSDYFETVKCAKSIVTAGLSFGRAVMFFAQLSHTLSSVAVEQGVVFDTVVTNVGDCYSGHTGAFTCCRPGTYFFSWTIDTSVGHRINTEMMMNTSIIAINRAGDADHYSTASMSVVIHLHIGDEVWIRVVYRHPTTADILGQKASSFTGFLIQ
ncbi:complement C1q-like protein 3 isoform X2 [Pecten maximus]|uniref:complement C1q-like protein 3 isoform X2 n=1 Tax=Pecten maximus TaxID=6579 RepID=UPI0014580446|nr:complement C1q-like protein 3 isoform X2 [Pecten maximus]